jgi:hypothetical protein
MNFFCTEKHLIEWKAKSIAGSKKIYGLTLEEALSVAKMIFG